MHERLHKPSRRDGINEHLRTLGARIPKTARPARLGAIDDHSEVRATAEERHRPTITFPAETRIHRSTAVDRFCGTVGAQAFTVGRDVFLGKGADAGVLRHELAHVRDQESVMAPVIRRKGVRSELVRGDDRFEDFVGATDEIRDLYDEAASDTYTLYKPSMGTTDLPYWRGSVGKGTRARQGDPAEFRVRAKALAGWVDTAVSSAERLYAELHGVRKQFKPNEYLDFSMNPGDTKLYPDAESYDNGQVRAIESKHVTSPAQGAVDGHIKAATLQLEKRKTSLQGPPYDAWTAVITIDNGDNPWPYTPGAIKKLKKKPTRAAVIAEMIDRAKKYDQSTRQLHYIVIVRSSACIAPDTYEFDL